MAARVIVSGILGQGLFWRFGYDQLSVGGKKHRIMQIGNGERVAEFVYRRIPHTLESFWTVKGAEITLDLGRCLSEGLTTSRFGITPDAVACIVPQPLWSLIEAVEKLLSFMSQPRHFFEVDEEEFKVALACIYGSMFRYAQALAILALGHQIDRYLTRPLAKLIRKTGPAVPLASIAAAAWLTRKAVRDYNKKRAAVNPAPAA